MDDSIHIDEGEVNTIKECGGVEVQLHSFLTWALDGAEWSALRPGRITLGEGPRYTFNRRLGRRQGRSGRLALAPLPSH